MSACRGTPTARALYRVFVSPLAPAAARPVPPPPFPRPQGACRALYFTKSKRSSKKVPSAFDDPDKPLDENIGVRFVNFVTPSGEFQPQVSLGSILRDIDREREHVRRVSIDQNGVPLVKIFTKMDLQQETAVRLMAAKATATTKTQDAGKKELELNWAIDTKNDLPHRLRKLEEWLQDGKNVEVLLAQKRGGRRATLEEAEGVLERIRKTVASVEGAAESDAMDGQVGKRALLRFHVREPDGSEKKSKTRKLIENRAEKLARKEEEKAEWKAELRRREERRAQREQEKRAQSQKTPPLP